jgi:hypothetical protein
MQRIFSKANRRLVAVGMGAFSLMAIGSSGAKATLIESWEGTLDSWQVPSPAGSAAQQANFQSGFSTTNGVTNGADSLSIGATAANTGSGPDYSQMLLGPSTTGNTSILGNASAIQLDIFTPPGSFNGFLQFDMDINNADTGFQSLDGFSYPSTTIGSETTLTFSLTPAETATLHSSANPTSIIIQVGGGFSAGNETMYLDNLRTVPAPEPASLGILAGGLLLLGRRRHKSC